MSFGRVVLLLFVIDLGIASGAGLYESSIVLPRWLATGTDGQLHWYAEAARADDTGRRFWAVFTTGPLTVLALANLWVGWRRAIGQLRYWWVTSAALSLLERALTLGYFIPTMVGLMSSVDSPDAIATATRWMSLNYLRHALVLAAWLAALKTFALAQNVRRRGQEYHER
jgi:hypothetical protein